MFGDNHLISTNGLIDLVEKNDQDTYARALNLEQKHLGLTVGTLCILFRKFPESRGNYFISFCVQKKSFTFITLAEQGILSNNEFSKQILTCTTQEGMNFISLLCEYLTKESEFTPLEKIIQHALGNDLDFIVDRHADALLLAIKNNNTPMMRALAEKFYNFMSANNGASVSQPGPEPHPDKKSKFNKLFRDHEGLNFIQYLAKYLQDPNVFDFLREIMDLALDENIELITAQHGKALELAVKENNVMMAAYLLRKISYAFSSNQIASYPDEIKRTLFNELFSARRDSKMSLYDLVLDPECSPMKKLLYRFGAPLFSKLTQAEIQQEHLQLFPRDSSTLSPLTDGTSFKKSQHEQLSSASSSSSAPPGILEINSAYWQALFDALLIEYKKIYLKKRQYVDMSMQIYRDDNNRNMALPSQHKMLEKILTALVLNQHMIKNLIEEHKRNDIVRYNVTTYLNFWDKHTSYSLHMLKRFMQLSMAGLWGFGTYIAVDYHQKAQKLLGLIRGVDVCGKKIYDCVDDYFECSCQGNTTACADFSNKYNTCNKYDTYYYMILIFHTGLFSVFILFSLCCAKREIFSDLFACLLFESLKLCFKSPLSLLEYCMGKYEPPPMPKDSVTSLDQLLNLLLPTCNEHERAQMLAHLATLADNPTAPKADEIIAAAKSQLADYNGLLDGFSAAKQIPESVLGELLAKLLKAAGVASEADDIVIDIQESEFPSQPLHSYRALSSLNTPLLQEMTITSNQSLSK